MTLIRSRIILALFVAIAAVLHVAETWIPVPLPVPGAKLGLANIVAVMVIYRYTVKDAFFVSVLRVFLGSLLGGTFMGPAFAMSLCGALVSTAAMGGAYRYLRQHFSIVGVSIIGAVVHNLGQLSIAAVLVANSSLLWYLPYLILFAVPTGIATGYCAAYFIRKLSAVLYTEQLR